MKNSLKISKAILFIICISCLIIISGLTTLYGDDYTYGAYCLDGLGEFLRLNVSHYAEVNGRAFVHLVLECVLAFKDALFFAVIPLMVWGAFSTFYKAFADSECKKEKITFLTFAISGVMCLSVFVLREGLLWVSGAMNYIFPLIFTYAVFTVMEKADNGKCPWYYYLTAFLAGATTEQGGAMSFAAALMYIIYYRITQKRIDKRAYILAGIVFIGYLSIFLSPATLGRLFRETAENTEGVMGRFKHIFTLCFDKGGALWLFAVTELALLTRFEKNKRYFIFIGLSLLAVSAVMILCGLLLTGGFLLAGLMTATVIAMLLTKTAPKLAIAAITAGAGIVMLVCSTSFGFRNLIPAYFTMIAVSASVLAGYLQKKPPLLDLLVSGAVVAIAVITFLPVISGYAGNRKIINQNLEEYKSGGMINYNLGIQYPYGYVQFFETGGVYEDGFRKIYKIPKDTKIRLYGSDFEDFSCNGRECKPVFIKNGVRYYPMRDVLESYGWELLYDNGKTDIIHGDTEIKYLNDYAVFIREGQEIAAADWRCIEEGYKSFFTTYTYHSGEMFEKVFDIVLD